ncbi:MAG: hypothetical protein D6738_06000 [Acidobacteria bacterium]|nr:MAG: hypothetical protein D6738_06000 [Acidobacteriota bacterium]
MSLEPVESRPSPGLIAGVAAVVVGAAVIGFFVGRWSVGRPQEPARGVTSPAASEEPAEEQAPSPGTIVVADERVAAAIRELDAFPPDRLTDEACGEIDAMLDEACGDAGIGERCGELRAAAVALAQHPPVASGELFDQENVIANTFHLFRVLGRDRLEQFGELLDRRGLELEPVGAALYRWVASREACGEGAERNVTLERLDDYAVWSLSSLGGQAYLRRRSPAVEGLATFYALVTVDRAIREGREPYGLDPRRFLPRCEALIRGAEPAYRDAYVEVLTRFRHRWGGL